MRDKWITSAGTILVVVAFIALLAGANFEPGPQPYVTRTEFEERMEQTVGEQEFRNEVERIDQELALKADRNELVPMAQAIQQNSESINRLDAKVGDNTQAIDSLNTAVGQNGRKINEQAKRLDNFEITVTLHKRILDAISQQGERYLPNIYGNMDSAKLKEDMDKVVQKTFEPNRGELIIKNRTNRTHVVYVNREPGRSIAPDGEEIFRDLPVGNVSTRIKGQHAINWAVGPPSFEQRIDIVDLEPGPADHYHTLEAVVPYWIIPY